MLGLPDVIPLPGDQGLSSVIRVMVSEARGPGFKYQPREIRPTLYFVLGLPDVIPLPVDQGLSSRGPGFKYQLKEVHPTLYCVLRPPNVILSLWIKDFT